MARVSTVTHSFWLPLSGLLSICMVISVASAESSSFASLWEHELPNTAMPEALEKLASPLSPSSTQLFLSLLKAGKLQAYDKQFCASAQIFCSQKAITPVEGPQPRVCIPPYFNYEYGVLPCRHGASAVSALQESGIFFSQEDLVVGKIVQLPDTSNDLHGMKFLPALLADALPFDARHLPELTSFYGVAKGSDMELEMENTLAHCSFKSEHEVRVCQLSGEGMVSFVINTVGHGAVVYSPAAILKQKATVMDISTVGAPGEKVATCHDMRFPSMVYSCHMTHTSQLMVVSLKLANGHVARQLALCHMDTSYWNPSHIAFQVLSSKPGESAVCHWFPENSFTFVQARGM